MVGISSNKLKDNKEKILTIWGERCLASVDSARKISKLALRNSLPLYLDHLAEALDLNKKMDFKSIFLRDEEASRIGKLHGTDRAQNASYQLTEVIFEYHILREVIFEILELDGTLGGIQRDIILDSLEQAVNDAAVEFSEVHTDLQQKFVDTLSHDLMNPIAATKMNAALISKRGGATEYLILPIKRIISSMNRLESMIHDLLDAGKVRAGEELSLQFIHCNLDHVIKDVVDEMSYIHGDRIIFNSCGPIEGKFGRDGLRRAVENLIGNAVKYSTPQTLITVSTQVNDKFVEMEVHNLGPIIPKEEIPLLFKKYRRSQSAHEGNNVGWGLGLTLVRGVMEAHKGSASVESVAGKGTSFKLTIPLIVELN